MACTFDILVYIDVSYSISKDSKKANGVMFTRMLNQWFNMMEKNPNLDLRFRIATFGSKLNGWNSMHSESSRTKEILLKIFRRQSQRREWGTRTDLVFNEVGDGNSEQQIGRYVTPGNNLLILVVTDRIPFIKASKRQMKKLLKNAGLPLNGEMSSTRVGAALFEESFARFRTKFPSAKVAGLSNLPLPEEFATETFDSYFTNRGQTLVLEDWTTALTRSVCSSVVDPPPPQAAPVCRNIQNRGDCKMEPLCKWNNRKRRCKARRI